MAVWCNKNLCILRKESLESVKKRGGKTTMSKISVIAAYGIIAIEFRNTIKNTECQ